MVDWTQLLMAALVLAAPGVAWTWTLAGRLPPLQAAVVAVVVALSVPFATLYVLNVFLEVPVSAFNAVMVFLLTATGAASYKLVGRLDAAA